MADPAGWYGYRPGNQINPQTGLEQYLQGGQSFLPSGEIATHKGGFNAAQPPMQPLMQYMGGGGPGVGGNGSNFGAMGSSQPSNLPVRPQGGQNPMGSQQKPPSMPMFPTQQMMGQNMPPQGQQGPPMVPFGGGQMGGLEGQPPGPQGMMPQMDFADFFKRVQSGEMQGAPMGRPPFDPSQFQRQGM